MAPVQSASPGPRQHPGAPLPRRPVAPALVRGWRRQCPCCGRASLLAGYLKVVDRCPACGEDLHHQRADDFPPYLTIVAVGHVIVPLILLWEQTAPPPLWLVTAVAVPATASLALWLLPRIKGAVVGLQWALRMHGFGAGPDTATRPDPIDDQESGPGSRY